MRYAVVASSEPDDDLHRVVSKKRTGNVLTINSGKIEATRSVVVSLHNADRTRDTLDRNVKASGDNS